jgi:ParB family transcriptional regulator, chromosome partitioning protein
MSKLLKFIEKNQQHMLEDAGERPSGSTPPPPTKLDGRTRLANAAAIAVDKITADPQHREVFDEDALQRLAASLLEHGQLQPIRVRWDQERGTYIIIAGERRWRAAKLAGLMTVECVIVEGDLDQATILRQQVIENALREDLKPVEKAKAFKAVMDQEGIDGKGLAEKLHIDPSTVSRALALLKLDDETQAKVDSGEVAPTVAIQATKRASKKGAGKGGSKEITYKLSTGMLVTVKSRKVLDQLSIAQALEAALGQSRAAA